MFGVWCRLARRTWRRLGIGVSLIFALGTSAGEPANGAKFWVGGDVNLGAGGEKVFAQVASSLQGAPGFVNLEGPVVAADARSRLKVFNTPEGLRTLQSLGVRAASIANNHAQDAGVQAPGRTIDALRAVEIAPAGLSAGAAVAVIGGKRVVFTSHDLGNGLPASLREDLSAARASGDLLVATFHVSGTPAEKPSALLRNAAGIALAAGARVIAAHGSHRIGPVERRGDAVIAWGLGNFAFACDCTRERAGMILEVSVEADGRLRAAIIPIRAGIRGGAVALESKPDAFYAKLNRLGGSPIHQQGIRGRF